MLNHPNPTHLALSATYPIHFLYCHYKKKYTVHYANPKLKLTFLFLVWVVLKNVYPTRTRYHFSWHYPSHILRRLSEDYRLKPLYLYHVSSDKSSSSRSPLTFDNALLLFDERVLCSFFINVLTT